MGQCRQCGAGLRAGVKRPYCHACGKRCPVCDCWVLRGKGYYCPDCNRLLAQIAEVHGNGQGGRGRKPGAAGPRHPLADARLRRYAERAGQGLPLFEGG